MKFLIRIVLSFFLIAFVGCSTDASEVVTTPSGMYFPPLYSDNWETISLEALEWNTEAETDLYQFLEDKDTKAFIIVKDGKIALEKYFGTFVQDSIWYWASAGKTLTSFTVGIAQEQKLLNIEDSTSDFLGQGWTSTTTEQEQKITVRNQLTMTSGLKNNLLVFSCTAPICLTYDTEPNT